MPKFQFIDADNDGTRTGAELAAVLKALGYSQEEAATLQTTPALALGRLPPPRSPPSRLPPPSPPLSPRQSSPQRRPRLPRRAYCGCCRGAKGSQTTGRTSGQSRGPGVCERCTQWSVRGSSANRTEHVGTVCEQRLDRAAYGARPAHTSPT